MYSTFIHIVPAANLQYGSTLFFFDTSSLNAPRQPQITSSAKLFTSALLVATKIICCTFGC